MDALDLRIIRAMGVRPFETWPRPLDPFRTSDIADALKVNPDTVRERIAKMEGGFIAGYEIYPNVHHLGLEQTTFHVALPRERKQTVIAAMEPMDGVVGLYDFLGDDLCVDLYYLDEADLQRKRRLISQIAGVEMVRFYERAAPPVTNHLDATDWRIIQALRGDARRDLGDLANVLGISRKTVLRRFQRMHEQGAFDRVVSINPQAAPSLFLFTLVAGMGPERAHVKARLFAALEERFLYAWGPPEMQGEYHMMLFAETTGEVEELRARGAAVEGVTSTEVRIPSGVIYHGEWLDQAIGRRTTVSRFRGPPREAGHPAAPDVQAAVSRRR